jgi:L-seryl-tRNA(Ser) seleniumtransferase
MQDGAGLVDLARRLRLAEQPVVGRIEHDRLLFDPRTVAPDEDPVLIASISQALQS